MKAVVKIFLYALLMFILALISCVVVLLICSFLAGALKFNAIAGSFIVVIYTVIAFLVAAKFVWNKNRLYSGSFIKYLNVLMAFLCAAPAVYILYLLFDDEFYEGIPSLVHTMANDLPLFLPVLNRKLFY